MTLEEHLSLYKGIKSHTFGKWALKLTSGRQTINYGNFTIQEKSKNIKKSRWNVQASCKFTRSQKDGAAEILKIVLEASGRGGEKFLNTLCSESNVSV